MESHGPHRSRDPRRSGAGRARHAAASRHEDQNPSSGSREEAARDRSRFAGRTVLVTTGRTEEPIDPVRVLTNRSSGKMGFALAEAARARGARVIVVAGVTSV